MYTEQSMNAGRNPRPAFRIREAAIGDLKLSALFRQLLAAPEVLDVLDYKPSLQLMTIH